MNITKLLGYEDDMQVVATLTNGQELIRTVELYQT